MLLARPIIALFFQIGQFGPDATARAAFVLVFYGAGVWIFCSMQIVTRIFYSIGDTKTPTKVALATVFLNVALNLMLIGPLDAAGLALSTTICALINLGFLLYALKSRDIRAWDGRLPTFLLRLAGAVSLMAATGLLLEYLLPDAAGKLNQAVRLFVPLFSMLAVFFAAARVLRVDEFNVIFRSLLSRGRKKTDDENPR
jgi:putative peptidoglycan lipid II flippase